MSNWSGLTGSCAMAKPPQALMARNPSTPAGSMPLKTTPAMRHS